MRRSGQGPHLAATVLEFDQPLKLESLHRSASALAHRHPLLNARVRRSPLHFTAEWIPSEAIPMPVAEQAGQSLEEVVQNALAHAQIDIFKPGPNLEFHLWSNHSNHYLLLIWPHSLFDAIGIDKLIGELDSDGTDPRQDWGETNPTSGYIREIWNTARPMVEEMRTFPSANIRSLHRPKSPPGAPQFEVLRFDKKATQQIHNKLSSTSGELLKIPYFAALSARSTQCVIAKRSAGPTTLLISLPVQRVPEPSKRPLFHNHMTPWSLILAPELADDLATATRSLYRSYASFIRRKLPAAMDALTKLNERCPSRFYLHPIKHFLNGEICSLFHSHTGELANHTHSLFGRVITDAFHLPTVSTPPGIGIFFSERRGKLTATLSWREGSLDQDELNLLRHHLIQDLGATPSPRP